ncbi:MAG: class I SAM-dependent methyltransferase, partial [Nitrospirales bacterium]
MKQDVQHLDIFPNYGKVVAHPWSLKRKLIYKVVPAHVFHPLRNELHLAWVRLKSLNARKQFEHAEDLLVNLGAGPKGKPGWINVDTHPYEGINCVYDCRKSLPFPDNSVRGIFSEHFFEHLDYTEEVPWFLSECHRVLKPGGVFRVIVPDIELYMQAYCTDGWEELSKIRPLESDHRDSCYKCKI